MRGKVFIFTIIFTLILGQSVALGMGFWDKVARHLIKEHKIHTKKVEKEKKEFEKQVKQQRRAWEKNMYEKEIDRVVQENPLDRQWLQKIEVYKDVLKKKKDQQTLQKIIDHIKIYGEQRYQENLSGKHKEFLKDLEKAKSEIDKKKSNPGATASGVVILGGIAYILRLIVFKVPL